MNWKRLCSVLAVVTIAFGLTACSSDKAPVVEEADAEVNVEEPAAAEEAVTVKGTYEIHVNGYDWDAGVDKAVLSFDRDLDGIDANALMVQETKQVTDWEQEDKPVVEATLPRTVLDIYLSDSDGNKVEGPSKYAAVELYCSPSEGTPLLYADATGYNTWSEPYILSFSLTDKAALTSEGMPVDALEIDAAYTKMTTEADMFELEEFEASDGVVYGYAAYTPEEETDVLFVYLHGLGEGGAGVTGPTDAKLAILTDDAASLAQEDFQTKVGGAAILFPQCPTMWMDADGNSVSAERGAKESFYLPSLTELIDSYAEEHGYDKIVIGGASNGGYMTMLMAKEYGDKYTGYVPACEAYGDKYLSDADIQKMAGTNMYFIYSEADDVVNPKECSEPTIKRLKEAGAKNLHVSTSENIYDEAGEYLNVDGSQYTDEKGDIYCYGGHWAWVYLFDNITSCDDCEETVFDWIGEIVK